MTTQGQNTVSNIILHHKYIVRDLNDAFYNFVY